MDIGVLERAYDELVHERDRLRDARAGFASRLGALPAAAVVAIGVVGSAAETVKGVWLVEASLLLAASVVLGLLYGGLGPYRLLRGTAQKRFDPGDKPNAGELGFGLGADVDRRRWLWEKIRMEQDICGPLTPSQRFTLNRRPGNLQAALDSERYAGIVIQGLAVAVVFVLVLGIVLRDCSASLQYVLSGGTGALIGLALVVLARSSGRGTHAPRS